MLFVAGADDDKFAAIARKLAREAPRAASLVVPAAGHAVHLEQSHAVVGAAVEFFASWDDDQGSAR